MKSTVRNGVGAVAAITLLAVILIIHSSNKTDRVVTLESSYEVEDKNGMNAFSETPKSKNKVHDPKPSSKTNFDKTGKEKSATLTAIAEEESEDDTKQDTTAALDQSTTTLPYAAAEGKHEVNGSKHSETVPESTANVIDWKYDFEESADLGVVIKSRITRLYQLCESHREDIKASYTDSSAAWQRKFRTYTHIAVTEKANLCMVAKVGSTFWKSFFIYVATGRIENGLRIEHLLPDTVVTMTTFQSDKAVQVRPTFIVVRNPWKRLVSLYQQKIESYLKEDGSPPDTFTEAAPYKYISSVCKKKESKEDFVTFRHLLDCVLRKYEQGSVNVHWQPAYEICDVCNVKFDYIVRVENMMNEGEYVLTKAGLKDAGTILDTVRDGTIRDAEKHKPRPSSDYYSDIPTDIIDTLRTMYRYEIEIFNYPDTPFTV